MIKGENYLNVNEASAALGVSAPTLRKLARDQKLITHYVIGKRLRFAQADLDDYINRSRSVSHDNSAR